jgi:YgiT-type zinc finger domain-containing protein
MQEKSMKCVICRQADVEPGHTTVTLERGGLTLVVKGVPALVCPNCGEAYLDETITAQLLNDAEAMVEAGALVDVRQYVPA